MNNCLLLHCCVIASTMCEENGTTLYIQIGSVQFWPCETSGIGDDLIPFFVLNGMGRNISTCRRRIIIVAITTSKNLTNKEFLCIIGSDKFSLMVWIFGCSRTDMYIRVPFIRHSRFITNQFCRQCLIHRLGSTNGSSNIITTIDMVDHRIARGILSIDVHIGITTHIGHTCTTKHLIQITLVHNHLRTSTNITLIATTIHITANSNLCLHHRCRHTEQ